MQLVLFLILCWVLIGFAAPRFAGRQQVIVVGFAFCLAFAQFFFARFL
jgi:hypothetical protein